MEEKKEQKETGLSIFTEAHDLMERLGILDDLKKEIELQREAIREKEAIISQLTENEAREKEKIDTILTRMRDDIKILSSTLMLQPSPEESEPARITEPEPQKTQESEASLSTGQPESDPKPEEPEKLTPTFAESLWLIGQDVKRFLRNKVF